MSELSRHLADRLEPMSAATAALLSEDFNLRPHDRLRVSVVRHKLNNGQFSRRFRLEVFSSDINHTPSTHARTSWWQRIPGAVYYSAGVSEAPISDITVLVCIASWGKDRIEFSDDDEDEARTEFQLKLIGFFRDQKVAKHIARYKENKEVPEHAPTGNPSRPPMPHQRVAASCLLDCDSSFDLFMEMRTGKSYSVVMAMDEDCVKNPHVMNLIICPKNVRTNWEAEIRACTTKNVNIITLRRSKLHRVKLLLEAFEFRKDYDYTVVIVSYDGVSRTLSQLLPFTWRWGVADESHYFKQSRTERWKALVQLRDQCEKRVGLTGTPICNSAMDLYTQFEWLNDGHSGFGSFDQFAKFYGVLKKSKKRRKTQILVGMQNVPLLQERLARSSYRVTMAEALPYMPPVTHKILEVEMSPEQAQVYDQVAGELVAQIERDLDNEEKKVSVSNILTRLLRLAQITSGFVAVDGDVDLDTGEVLTREIDRFDPNPKLDTLVEYLKERDPSSKTIVWAAFVENIRQIRARLALEGIECVTYYGRTSEAERDEAVRKFNEDPNVKVFIGNPAAGGVGINLSGRCLDESGNRRTQCDAVFYYSQGWSSPVRVQSQARPRDKNCDWSIEIVDAVVLDTIDFQIRDRVVNKIEHAMQIQDIRHLLKRLVQ